MNKFYITFGQRSPFRNGYVLIEADSESDAREIAFDALGKVWAFMYNEKTFDPCFFPAGQLGETIR